MLIAKILALLLLLVFISDAQLQTFETTTESMNVSTTEPFVRRAQVTILGALTLPEHVQIFAETTNYSTNNIDVLSRSFILKPNPLLIISELCEVGNRSQSKVIIAGQTPDGSDLTLTAMAYVSDYYHVPILAVASRENIFSDRVSRTDGSTMTKVR